MNKAKVEKTIEILQDQVKFGPSETGVMRALDTLKSALPVMSEGDKASYEAMKSWYK